LEDHEIAEDPDPQAPRPPPLVRLAVVFYGVLFAAALGWGAVAGRSLFYANAEAAAKGPVPVRDLGIGLLAGAIVILLSFELTRRTRWGESLARALAAVLGRLGWGQCILLAVLSGVAEEAFFRGAIQPHVGLLAASVIFGAAHFAPQRDLWPWTAFSLLAGLLLGVLFESTGNLIAPITAHALINAINLRLLSVRYGASLAGPPAR
jgi:membrane protease YdiL (CAAX protease family)